MAKDMSPRNRPKFNTDSGLTPNGRGVACVRPGSAPAGTAAGYRRASRPALREFFVPGTLAAAEATPSGSGGLPADVEALVALLGHPGRAAGVDVATLAAVALVAGLGTKASMWSGTSTAVTGPDVESDVVQVLAAADRSRAFTASPRAGLVAGA